MKKFYFIVLVLLVGNAHAFDFGETYAGLKEKALTLLGMEKPQEIVKPEVELPVIPKIVKDEQQQQQRQQRDHRKNNSGYFNTIEFMNKLSNMVGIRRETSILSAARPQQLSGSRLMLDHNSWLAHRLLL